jgi:hypothetical protein
MINTLRANWPPTVEFHQLKLAPGEYYPRIARPGSPEGLSPGYLPDQSIELQISRAKSTGQLHAFIQTLEAICRVVHPFRENLRTYGHEIRNILVLACTEIEAYCKNILRDNEYNGGARYDRLTTADYVCLLTALRLNDYTVSLNYYPWYERVSPFASWSQKTPTKSLGWYYAYNQVKHDRESHFEQATLGRAIDAVTGCFVLLCAQYGLDFALQGNEADRAFFQIVAAPRWAPSEIYLPPFSNRGYQPRPYFR